MTARATVRPPKPESKMPMGASVTRERLDGGRACRDGGRACRDGGRACRDSRPELALEALLGLVDRALVGPGGQVLPAPVADYENDVRPRAGAHALRCLAECRVQNGTGRDAGEDSLRLEQLRH